MPGHPFNVGTTNKAAFVKHFKTDVLTQIMLISLKQTLVSYFFDIYVQMCKRTLIIKVFFYEHVFPGDNLVELQQSWSNCVCWQLQLKVIFLRELTLRFKDNRIGKLDV